MPTRIAHQLLGEAFDPGEYPDLFDPGAKRKLEQGRHPLGQHPSLSRERATSMASRGYQNLMAKIQRYTGTRITSPRQAMSLPQTMFQLLRQATRLEQENKEELEQLAVDTALSLPQFAGARKAIENGHLKVDARLGAGIDLSRARYEEPEDEDEGGGMGDDDDGGTETAEAPTPKQVNKIEAELDELVLKRKFVNHLIQGAAANSSYAFHLVDDRLREIDPALPNTYGALMALAEFGHWMMPEEMVAMALGSDEAKGGKAELGAERDGTPVIRAQGQTFPMLVHEVVKGLMEYLSFSDEEDEETRREVQNRADVVNDEMWHMKLGPQMWEALTAAIGEDQTKMARVYDKLVRLPTGEFNRVMRGIMEEDPGVVAEVRKLAR